MKKIEWKWTKGEPYAKSRRPIKKKQFKEPDNSFNDETFTQEVENSAYTTSLNHDENTWDILNQGLYNNNNEFKQSNKREDLDYKISDRELVQQCGYNPFMENNYTNDISNSDKFLKPVNTTLGREKADE
jgi:hypothetical protein